MFFSLYFAINTPLGLIFKTVITQLGVAAKSFDSVTEGSLAFLLLRGQRLAIWKPASHCTSVCLFEGQRAFHHREASVALRPRIIPNTRTLQTFH